MVRIAPVRLSFNPRTLWFDAAGLELHANDKVVVSTARGDDFGTVSDSLFDMDERDAAKLKSPLKPVKRLALDEDVQRSEELLERGREALPIFKKLAREAVPDMNPVAVEFLFDSDKAVFYFEAEERVDFRDLVRKLASEFHVRVDMKQIGVRDEARLIGGIGHCGQELCCRRLGGGFDPVSIRMAKEQDLSLNPQKISGICGRLMCCLRYEYEAYKDFHGRAPKKNAKIQTPDGEGKVVDMNVPREIISVKVGDEKAVKVPLADFDEPDEGTRPNTIGPEAWEQANEPASFGIESALNLFTNELSGNDKLADRSKVRHVHGAEPKKQQKSRSRRKGGSSEDKQKAQSEASSHRKPRRRRSTTVSSEAGAQAGSENASKLQKETARDSEKQKRSSSRRRSRSRSASSKQQAQVHKDQKPQGGETGSNSHDESKGQQSKVGRNSSALRANRDNANAQGEASAKAEANKSHRRRRRSHKGTAQQDGKSGE